MLGDVVDNVALDNGDSRIDPVEAADVNVDTRKLALFTANFNSPLSSSSAMMTTGWI